MVAQKGTWRAVVVGVVLVGLCAPVPSGAQGSLGTARGLRGVELSLDGGKGWLPLGARSLPVLDDTQIRSMSGGALVDFTDGSRVNVLPFSMVRVRDTGDGTALALAHGRITFWLPPGARVQIGTPTARLTPMPRQAAAGELFVSADGTAGVQMKQGSLSVQELGGARRMMMASLEPVFVPRPPQSSGPLFGADVPAAPAAGAKGVFTARGESVGYLGPAAQFFVHPGYTADLTSPFSPKLVQLAMAKIPAGEQLDAMPLFDVNGSFLGYVAGPVFYAQAQIVPPSGTEALPATSGGSSFLGMSTATASAIGIGLGATTSGGILVGQCLSENWPCGGGGGSVQIATPLRPRR